MINFHRILTLKTIAGICLALASTTLFAANGKPFQDLQDQIDALKAQLDGLGGAAGPYEVSVDCDAGDTINGALQAAPAVTSELRIYINGSCNESVSADRQNFFLIGESPNSEINGTGGPAFSNGGYDRSYLINTNVSANGSFSNIYCSNGSLVVIQTDSSRPSGDGTGLNAIGNCALIVRDSDITGGNFGMIISHDSNALLNGVNISGAGAHGIIVNNNSNATLGESPFSGSPTVIENNGLGGAIDGLGSLIVQHAIIRNNNDVGLIINLNSYLRVTDGSILKVLNNGSDGLLFTDNASAAFWLEPEVEISGNGFNAISCDGTVAFAGELTSQPATIINGSISPECPADL